MGGDRDARGHGVPGRKCASVEGGPKKTSWCNDQIGRGRSPASAKTRPSPIECGAFTYDAGHAPRLPACFHLQQYKQRLSRSPEHWCCNPLHSAMLLVVQQAMLSVLLCSFLFLQLGHASQYGPLMEPIARQNHTSPLFSFSTTWQHLGPFQIGTRGTLVVFFVAPDVFVDLVPQKQLGEQIHWSMRGGSITFPTM